MTPRYRLCKVHEFQEFLGQFNAWEQRALGIVPEEGKPLVSTEIQSPLVNDESKVSALGNEDASVETATRANSKVTTPGIEGQVPQPAGYDLKISSQTSDDSELPLLVGEETKGPPLADDGSEMPAGQESIGKDVNGGALNDAAEPNQAVNWPTAWMLRNKQRARVRARCLVCGEKKPLLPHDRMCDECRVLPAGERSRRGARRKPKAGTGAKAEGRLPRAKRR